MCAETTLCDVTEGLDAAHPVGDHAHRPGEEHLKSDPFQISAVSLMRRFTFSVSAGQGCKQRAKPRGSRIQQLGEQVNHAGHHVAPVQHEGPLLLAVDLGDDDLPGCGLVEELHHRLRAQHWEEEEGQGVGAGQRPVSHEETRQPGQPRVTSAPPTGSVGRDDRGVAQLQHCEVLQVGVAARGGGVEGGRRWQDRGQRSKNTLQCWQTD